MMRFGNVTDNADAKKSRRNLGCGWITIWLWSKTVIYYCMRSEITLEAEATQSEREIKAHF